MTWITAKRMSWWSTHAISTTGTLLLLHAHHVRNNTLSDLKFRDRITLILHRHSLSRGHPTVKVRRGTPWLHICLLLMIILLRHRLKVMVIIILLRGWAMRAMPVLPMVMAVRIGSFPASPIRMGSWSRPRMRSTVAIGTSIPRRCGTRPSRTTLGSTCSELNLSLPFTPTESKAKAGRVPSLFVPLGQNHLAGRQSNRTNDDGHGGYNTIEHGIAHTGDDLIA
mmetsp:Transcript_26341/g.76027  ORF Transcript_26341/g.76027 Transcript_26341/m.76027 type:complete len:224 (+) Transcript_26341:153-824(+)